MKINYVEHKDGTKLFSFYRHDFQTYGEGEDLVGIDGGFDYQRIIGTTTSKQGEIKELIQDIREQFTWGKNFDENNVQLEKTEYIKLKDLTTSHIVNILIYFTNKLKPDSTLVPGWISVHSIFLEELNYRKL